MLGVYNVEVMSEKTFPMTESEKTKAKALQNHHFAVLMDVRKTQKTAFRIGGGVIITIVGLTIFILPMIMLAPRLGCMIQNHNNASITADSTGEEPFTFQAMTPDILVVVLLISMIFAVILFILFTLCLWRHIIKSINKSRCGKYSITSTGRTMVPISLDDPKLPLSEKQQGMCNVLTDDFPRSGKSIYINYP